MDEPLDTYRDLPTQVLEPGAQLLVEGERGGAMYVLVSGSFEVRRGGVLVTLVAEPGSFLGEVAALLGTPYGADVVARDRCEVAVIDDATDRLAADPALTMAVARLLARRLQAVTSYLGDLRRQYADAGGHLALMDQVLAELVRLQPGPPLQLGSERSDVPPHEDVREPTGQHPPSSSSSTPR